MLDIMRHKFQCVLPSKSNYLNALILAYIIFAVVTSVQAMLNYPCIASHHPSALPSPPAPPDYLCLDWILSAFVTSAAPRPGIHRHF